MTARIALPAICFTLALSGAIALTTPPPASDKDAPAKDASAKPEAAKPEPPKPAAREMPPDMKAYNEIGKITDPEKKIEAYEKWKKDFPESSMLELADSGIFSTLVHKFPDQKDRIRKFAATMYRNTPEKERGSIANNIADQLLTADMLLKDAEMYAHKSVDSMLLATYMQEQVAGYEKRKQKPPSGDELQKRFKESRAARLATLGRVELKLGHTAKGKQLLEEAYAATPTNVTVDAALGELAVKSGNDTKALEYLIPARLSGHAPKTANAAFESVYRKTHNGTLDGLDAMLDTEYEHRFPIPIHVDAYKPSEKRSDRVVLAEVFTGSGCPPCVAADLAFEAAMERYSRKDFVVLMYHQHIPRPDPMTNVETQARAKSYEVSGVPTFAIDGKKTVGGGSREMTKQVYDRFDKDLEKDLEAPAEAHLAVDARATGNNVRVHVTVGDVKSDSKDLKLQIALVEKQLRYSGENGVRFHPMVVRALGGEKGAGYALTGNSSFDQSFDVDEVSKAIKAHLDDYEAKGHRGESFTFTEKKYEINRTNLAVVVFIQDDKTKHVLQAGIVDLSSGQGTHPTTESSGNN